MMSWLHKHTDLTSKDESYYLWYVRNVDMNIFAASFNYQWKYLSKQQIRRMLDMRFGLVSDIHTTGIRNKGGVFGIDMYQVLADSRITLNTHANNNPNEAGNMRLFEATGAGSCLLTDWKQNLNDYFKVDSEIVTFRTKEEAESFADRNYYAGTYDVKETNNGSFCIEFKDKG